MKIIFKVLLIWMVFAGCNSEKYAKEMVHHGVNISYMDTMASPRDDFYRFVNGHWMDSVAIPADRGRWGSFDELRIMTSENTLEVLESTLDTGNFDGSTDKGKAAIFYSVAMDTMALDSMGLTPIRPLLDDIWAITSQKDINEFLGHHFKVNGSPYFSLSVRSGFDESDTNSLFLHPGALGLPERDYYVNTDSATLTIQHEYRILLAKVFDRLQDSEDSEKIADAVF